MWYKRTLPLLVVFVIGLLAFVQEYIPHPISSAFREEFTSWLVIMGGFGLFISVYSLLHMHYSRIRRKQAGWAYSGFVFFGAITMILLGLYNSGYGPLAPAPKGELTMFQWGYRYIQVPCSATVFSILAFFMASAAFRTFRARNTNAALLLLAAIIVMFGRVPVSEWVGENIFGYKLLFTDATDILMNYPNLAAKRAILLGMSLGIIAQSLRILFGIERSYLGVGD
ncbi:hypothetical protein HQ560_21095 [bacterium]|nr:hypothetical protein [bacterium]